MADSISLSNEELQALFFRVDQQKEAERIKAEKGLAMSEHEKAYFMLLKKKLNNNKLHDLIYTTFLSYYDEWRLIGVDHKQQINNELGENETDEINKEIDNLDEIIEAADTNGHDRSEAWIIKSNYYKLLNKPGVVLRCYNEAILIEPTVIKLSNRALLHIHNKDFDKAIADYNEAISLMPETWLLNDRANCNDAKGDYKAAITDYTEVIRQLNDKTVWHSYYNRAIVYDKLGDYDKALADIEEAVRLNACDNTWMFRGILFMHLRQYDKALEQFNEILAQNKGKYNTLHWRGHAWSALGNWDNAIADYNEVLHNHHSWAETYVSRALAYYQKGDEKKFNEDLSLAAHVYSHYIEYFFEIVDIVYKDNILLGWVKPLKKTYDTVFGFLEFCRSKEDKDNEIIYQYAPIEVLENICKTRTFRLRPVNYLINKEEWFVFYNRLMPVLKNDRPDIVSFLESLKETGTDNVVFIRSFTTSGDSPMMWNSARGENGCGVSIGTHRKKLNKGSGINKTRDTIQEHQENDVSTQSTILMPLEKCGLYNIIYLGENREDTEQQKELDKIADCLKDFTSDDLAKPTVKQFLADLFAFAAHLVKDKSYENENECRLIYFDTVRKRNPYIKISDGVYVETEPVLFEDDEDEVCFGPKVSEVSILKFRHIFKYSSLPYEGSVEKIFRTSSVK
jgi:tetratricopeptide (TPR) repeat protein